MTIKIKVPGFPESVSDGQVAEWHIQPGDIFNRDDILVDVETDKVMFEVPAPARGRLLAIKQDVGATVISGQVLAEIEPIESAAPTVVAAYPPLSDTRPDQRLNTDADVSAVSDEPLMTPSARRFIEEKGLDPKAIMGTGKHGRILKEDVIQGDTVAPDVDASTQDGLSPVVVEAAGRQDRRVPMSRLRARIAERLVEVQHTSAILTTFNEVNMQAVMALRSRYKKMFEERHGARLGFMSFFIRAATEALRRFPEVNASIDGEDMVYHDYYDVGVAVASNRGLVVPVIRDVDRLSMSAIEQQISDLAARASAGKLAIEDISGGTFTITNGGVFGSLLSTPIINPPQSAILGMHKIEQRAVVVDGNIEICPMMYLALSYDHRIIDGSGAVRFLVTIKDMLEDPARMLLEV